MIQFMLARHVAEGAKVVVTALDALPTHACDLKTTDTTHSAMMLDAWDMTI